MLFGLHAGDGEVNPAPISLVFMLYIARNCDNARESGTVTLTNTRPNGNASYRTGVSQSFSSLISGSILIPGSTLTFGSAATSLYVLTMCLALTVLNAWRLSAFAFGMILTTTLGPFVKFTWAIFAPSLEQICYLFDSRFDSS